MIGMTPAWFTFSGMYVLPPEVIRRPTTRLAYWTGIRRWPCSMNTTATMIRRPSVTMTENGHGPHLPDAEALRRAARRSRW